MVLIHHQDKGLASGYRGIAMRQLVVQWAQAIFITR